MGWESRASSCTLKQLGQAADVIADSGTEC